MFGRKKRKQEQVKKRQAPVIESLEPRILLSADLPGFDLPDADFDAIEDADVDHILAQARRDEISIRQEADAYVMDVLANLEEDLLRSLAVVRNGLHKLQADQAQLQAETQEEEASPDKTPAAD